MSVRGLAFVLFAFVVGHATGCNRSKCDASKVEALAEALEAAAPDEQPEIVSRQLVEACQIPQALGFLLDSFARQAELSLPLRTYESPKAPVDALTQICPSANTVTAEASNMKPEQRMAHLYDGCDFGRFALMDKETWLRGNPSSHLPFYGYWWLLEQGVSAAHSTAIANALILLDRWPYWASMDLKVPKVAYPLAELPISERVYLTISGIEINSKRLVKIGEDGSVESAAVQGHLIGSLYDELAEQVDRKKLQQAHSGETDWDSRLVLVADARLPMKTIVNVMYTAGRAGYTKYAFAAETGPIEYGAVEVEPPKFGGEQPRRLGVIIAKDGFHIRSSVGTPATPTHVGGYDTDSGEWDFDVLARAAKEHRKAHEGVTLTAEPPIEYGVVVRALATLRGNCRTDEGCLFSDLVIAAGVSNDVDMMARNAGILAMIEQESGDFLASPYGGAFAVGNGDEDVWGGLTGTEIGEAFGVGGLGLVGPRSDEANRDDRRVDLPARGARVPQVRQASATIHGEMDKNIIRRIVRAHINEVRYCYNQGLARDPKLEGRITVQFTISPKGKVPAAVVQESSLKDPKVGACIAQAVKRWTFPKPQAGNVVVSYPFVLALG